MPSIVTDRSNKEAHARPKLYSCSFWGNSGPNKISNAGDPCYFIVTCVLIQYPSRLLSFPMFLFLAPRSLTWWTQDQSQVSKVDNDTHPSTEFRKSLRPWNLDANVTGVAWPCCHSRLLHGIQTFLSCSKDELQGFASFDILHSNVQVLHGLFFWTFGTFCAISPFPRQN